MKCAACGYEKRCDQYVTDEVIYFRSGPKKGQIKTVNRKHVPIDGDKDDFIEIRPLGTDQDFIRMNSESWQSSTVAMYACPSCGTLKLEI